MKSRPKLLIRRSGTLRDKERELIKDLKETTLSFEKLGKKYGVSRQAIQLSCKKHGILRPKRPKGHRTQECSLCQKLIELSKKPHSEFNTLRTIVRKIGGSKRKYCFHLRMLREKGLVGEKFGRLRSDKAEEAYTIYFNKRLPISTIGRMVGYKNFLSTIKAHRKLGWNVPLSLDHSIKKGSKSIREIK